MKQRFINFQDGKLSYYVGGSSEGLPLLLIHGNSLGAFAFRKQFEGELASRHPLAAPDLPGHGDSLRTDYPPEVFVEVLSATVRALGWKEFVLVGHSFGGHLAIRAAVQLEGVRGVFAFGTPPLTSPPEPAKAFIPHPATALLNKPELEGADIPQLLKAFFQEDKPEALQEWGQLLQNTDPKFRIEGTVNFVVAAADEVGMIEDAAFPVAVVFGGEDPLCNQGYVRELALKNLWGNDIQLIANSGHSPQWEQPERFDELLSRYCQEL